jgi:hypothetical protein
MRRRAVARGLGAEDIVADHAPADAREVRALDAVVEVVRVDEEVVAGASMDWLEPFMTKRKYRQGDFLFHKDDPAGEMFLAVKGKYLVPEMGKTFGPGEIFGAGAADLPAPQDPIRSMCGKRPGADDHV